MLSSGNRLPATQQDRYLGTVFLVETCLPDVMVTMSSSLAPLAFCFILVAVQEMKELDEVSVSDAANSIGRRIQTITGAQLLAW